LALPATLLVLLVLLAGIILGAVNRRLGQDDFFGLTSLFYLLGIVSAAVVGGVVARRRPVNPIGWLFLLGTFGTTLLYLLEGLANFRRLQGDPAAAEIIYETINNLWTPVTMCFLFFLPLYFPDGRLVSARWRRFAQVGVVLSLLPLLEIALRPIYDFAPDGPLIRILVLMVLSTLFLTAAASLVVRFWHSRGVERQQIKWLVYAIVPLLLLLAPISFLSRLNRLNEVGAVLNAVSALYLTILPVVVGMAVLRYRLYDIDLIIRKTLVYSLLTAALALVYFGMVILVQIVLEQQSQLAILASTLVIAALFSPLHRRIQDQIDRRFYRRKYDAQQVLSRFAETARHEADLERLTAELISVVEHTMQPVSVSLWLRPANGERLKPPRHLWRPRASAAVADSL